MSYSIEGRGRGYVQGRGRGNFNHRPPHTGPRNSPPSIGDRRVTPPRNQAVTPEVIPKIASPVRPAIRFPASIAVPATQIDFGMTVGEKCMMKQATFLGRARPPLHDMRNPSLSSSPGDVVFALNLRLEMLDIYFPIESNGAVLRHRISIRFIHVPPKILHIKQADGGSVFVMALENPPRFYKRTDNMGLDNPTNWNEQKLWERIVKVDKGSQHPRSDPILFGEENNSLDLGRWITYAITFSKEIAQTTEFKCMCEAMKDWNLHLITSTDFHIKPRAVCNIWEYLSPAKSAGDYPAGVNQLGGRQPLPFPVLYQLYVCLSRGLINEHNITEEVLDRFSEMVKDHAHELQERLERVADRKTPLYNLMSIFDIPATRTRRRLPSSCTHARSCTITPTSIVFSSPSVETSNRVLRRYREQGDRFLRVRFSDELNLGKLYAGGEQKQEELYDRVRHVCQQGIRIGDLQFEFLAFGSSQFRDNGAYFFAPGSDLTAASIRSRLGDLSDIHVPSKYGARMGQAFSTTRQYFGPVTVLTERDIVRNKYNFTDGVGKISSVLCVLIADAFKISPSPSLVQFRLGGCKGVLAMCPTLKGNQVEIRDSQRKFDAAHGFIEIIRTSRFVGAHLNRQIILILSALGVPDKVFVDLERRLLEELESAMTSETVALDLLRRMVDFNHSSMVLAGMVESGFMASREPFVMAMLQLWKTWNMKYLKEKAKIPVAGGHLLGCADELGVLRGWFESDDPRNEDQLPEIFVHVDSDIPGDYKVIEGLCILGRNPSLHPGDIRVVRAVDTRELHHLKNVVVLPTTGDRDLGNMCSGGDLDGDDYFVIWDKNLFPGVNQRNQPAMNFESAPPVELNREVVVSDLIDFFIQYLKNDQLPAIAHAHLANADFLSHGVKSEACLQLAELHSHAVDYPKSGIPVKLPRELRPRVWPHFMEKKKLKEQVYHSKKVLGQLFDLVERKSFTPDYDIPFDEDILNVYAEDITDVMLKTAHELKSEYDAAMKRIMAQHAIKTEFEVFSAFVLSHNQERKDYTFAEDLGRVSADVKETFRDACTLAAGGREDRVLHPFVAAMYRITKEEVDRYVEQKNTVEGWAADPPMTSFPWIFDGEMNAIKKMETGALGIRVPKPTAPLVGETGAEMERTSSNDSNTSYQAVASPATPLSSHSSASENAEAEDMALGMLVPRQGGMSRLRGLNAMRSD